MHGHPQSFVRDIVQDMLGHYPCPKSTIPNIKLKAINKRVEKVTLEWNQIFNTQTLYLF